MTKRVQREHIFKMLFCKDFHEPIERKEQTECYLATIEDAREDEAIELKERVEAIVEKQGEIDVILENASSGWRLERMGKVELTIMRIAIYEMRFDENVPEKVAINEAVELAKKYGAEAAPGFINGVLAKLVREQK